MLSQEATGIQPTSKKNRRLVLTVPQQEGEHHSEISLNPPSSCWPCDMEVSIFAHSYFSFVKFLVWFSLDSKHVAPLI